MLAAYQDVPLNHYPFLELTCSATVEHYGVGSVLDLGAIASAPG